MKKLFELCLIMFSIIGLVACSKNVYSAHRVQGRPEKIKIQYKDVMDNYEEIAFSRDQGRTWIKSDDRLPAFDIWNVKMDEEVQGMVFFYATSYGQLAKQVEKYRKHPPFYAYHYPQDEYWDNLLSQYTEDFFEHYILLFYYKSESNISENYVYHVIKKDEDLILNVNRFEGMLTALSSWIEVITIKKEDIQDVNEFHVTVRTITPLKSTITLIPKREYIRDIYLNGLTLQDFEGLDNLKNVEVWTFGLSLDIYFNSPLSDDQFERLVRALHHSDSIRSVSYTSNTWIRVIVANRFYDQYLTKTLAVTDLLGEEGIDHHSMALVYPPVQPMALIKLELQNPGREQYEAMLRQLKELNFPFIESTDMNGFY